MIQPLKDFVVVSKEEGQKQTPGGLFVPSSVDEKIVKGTVTAVGPGYLSKDNSYVKLEVNVGDRVAFNKNALIEVKEDRDTFYLLREEHIYCIFK